MKWRWQEPSMRSKNKISSPVSCNILTFFSSRFNLKFRNNAEQIQIYLNIFETVKYLKFDRNIFWKID